MKRPLLYMICLLFSFIMLQGQDKAKPALEAPKDNLVFPPALKKAADEKKSVLLFFTGKDWCGPCQELEKTIIGTEEFKTFAKKKIIFLVLDFPQDEGGPSPENESLAQQYGVEGFPTLMLTDEKGVPYQKFGFEGQTKEAFIASIEKALKKRDLKTKFLASKDEKEKKQFAADYKAAKDDSENYIFFGDLIAYGILNDKDIKAEDKIKQLGDLYLYSTDETFVQTLGEDLKKIDPDKKLGTFRLFAIKEFFGLVMSQKSDKAYEFFLANKSAFKGNDVGYIYQFGMQMNQEGKSDRTIAILNFILEDEEIKKNEEAVKNLTEQLNEIKKAKAKIDKKVEDIVNKAKEEPAKKEPEKQEDKAEKNPPVNKPQEEKKEDPKPMDAPADRM